MNFTRYTYLVAGVFGLALTMPVAYSAVFNASEIMPSPMTTGLFLYSSILLFAAWQVDYIILATEPLRFRPMMIPAFLSAVIAPLNTVWLYFDGIRIWTGVIITFILIATLFLVAYHRTRPQANASTA